MNTIDQPITAEDDRAAMADILDRLESHVAVLSDELGDVRVSLMRKSTRVRELEDGLAAMLVAAQKRITVAAAEHAREVAWAWRSDDRHVPLAWTAAHPPDDTRAQTAAALLSEDDFAAYCEAFRAGWAAAVEEIAAHTEGRRMSMMDAEAERAAKRGGVEVKYGSGKVKI